MFRLLFGSLHQAIHMQPGVAAFDHHQHPPRVVSICSYAIWNCLCTCHFPSNYGYWQEFHVICYIDSILITGATKEEHLHNLDEVLRRLQQHGITLKCPKCVFMQDSVVYLGHRVDGEGLHTTDHKVEAACQVPQP